MSDGYTLLVEGGRKGGREREREREREKNVTVIFFSVNKKSTKFITTKKTIPNVNLRGTQAE